MRELWTKVKSHGGYARYGQHLATQRSRWLILKQRFTDAGAKQIFASTVVVDARLRDVLDWLFVGTTDLCPDDVLSVVMGYWSD